MALRIKTTWHESRRVHKGRRNRSTPKTLQDRASVIAFNLWKVALHHYTHMRSEGFRYADETQGMGTLMEFLAFLLQVVDRLVYGQVPEEERAPFINTVATHLARNLQTNREEILGPGDYVAPFIQLLNERGQEYAACAYEKGEPGYAFKRVCADHVADVLREKDQAENKWALEHVMDIEIPEMVKTIKRMTASALGIKNQ